MFYAAGHKWHFLHLTWSKNIPNSIFCFIYILSFVRWKYIENYWNCHLIIVRFVLLERELPANNYYIFNFVCWANTWSFLWFFESLTPHYIFSYSNAFERIFETNWNGIIHKIFRTALLIDPLDKKIFKTWLVRLSTVILYKKRL